jgi:hypothetical protein
MSAIDNYYSLKEAYDTFQAYDKLILTAQDTRLECRTFTISGISGIEALRAIVAALESEDVSRVILEAADKVLATKLHDLEQLAIIEATEFIG